LRWLPAARRGDGARAAGGGNAGGRPGLLPSSAPSARSPA
jgi:hypothetical protein